jgi:peroxiredoxin
MAERPPQRAAPLPSGTLASDLRLNDTPDQKVALSDFRGRPVVLAFYPADWSPVCSDQMVLYQEVMPEFEKHNAQLLGISVDGVWCHMAFARDRKLRFPLLADFEPKVLSRAPTTPTVKEKASASGRCSSSIRKALSSGATCRRSGSIPAPTAFSRRSRACREGGRRHECHDVGSHAGAADLAEPRPYPRVRRRAGHAARVRGL